MAVNRKRQTTDTVPKTFSLQSVRSFSLNAVSVITGAAVAFIAFKGAWHDLWVKWLVVPVSLLAVLVLACTYLFEWFPKRWAFLSTLVGATSIVCGVAGLYILNPEPPAFAVVKQTLLGTDDSSTPAFVVLEGDRFYYAAAYVALFDVTNLRMESVAVAEYLLEVEDSPSVWRALRVVPVMGRRVFFLGGGQPIEWVNDFKDLAAIMKASGLPLNGTIEGMVLVNSTNAMGRPMRMRITDAAGRVYVAQVTDRKTGRKAVKLRDGFPMTPGTNTLDLTKLLRIPDEALD